MVEFHSVPWAALAIVAGLLWTMDYYHIGKRPQIFLPHTFFNQSGSPLALKRGLQRHTPYLLGLMAWGLLAVALAGPRIPQDFANRRIKINDLYFVVDVSRSMLAEDFKPNRIEVAKQNILDFIKLRPTDRIGIIIFSREVFTLMPLTTDLALIEEIVGSISVGKLGSATNIGMR